LDEGDIAAVIKAAATSRYRPGAGVIASTGLRKGEALALRWDRIDLDARTLNVAATIARVNHALMITCRQ
jgi:integrase